MVLEDVRPIVSYGRYCGVLSSELRNRESDQSSVVVVVNYHVVKGHSMDVRFDDRNVCFNHSRVESILSHFFFLVIEGVLAFEVFVRVTEYRRRNNYYRRRVFIYWFRVRGRFGKLRVR